MAVDWLGLMDRWFFGNESAELECGVLLCELGQFVKLTDNY